MVLVFTLPLQVSDMHSRNVICGTLEALGPPELTLLAVALLPFEGLQAMVEQVAVDAWEAVKGEVCMCV
jgi:hypothetical protein